MMKICFINCTAETFTPTKSGAIATWVWELCRVAQGQGLKPLVITRSHPAKPYDWPHTVFLDYPFVPSDRIFNKLVRLQKKIAGWTHARQLLYMRQVARAVSDAGMQDGCLILNNDVEMAVFLRRCFPKSFIVHNFQNHNTCDWRYRRLFARSVSLATAVSDFSVKWNEEYFSFAPGTMQTLYNGVDVERFHPAQEPTPGLPTINFVGRTDVQKAPDLLLRAALLLAQRTKNFRLQILGSRYYGSHSWDPYQEEWERLSREVEQQGIEVYRPGFINRFELPGAMRKAHIHVTPSRWDEPFGLVTPEGMACGLATVASNTGGTPEIVGDAGFLFERDNVQELADHLEKLVSDEALRQEYSLRARERALFFSWENTWQRLWHLIETTRQP